MIIQDKYPVLHAEKRFNLGTPVKEITNRAVSECQPSQRKLEGLLIGLFSIVAPGGQNDAEYRSVGNWKWPCYLSSTCNQ